MPRGRKPGAAWHSTKTIWQAPERPRYLVRLAHQGALSIYGRPESDAHWSPAAYVVMDRAFCHAVRHAGHGAS